jgi:hypothetical protein
MEVRQLANGAEIELSYLQARFLLTDGGARLRLWAEMRERRRFVFG